MSCIVSGVISCCMIDRVWYMRAVLSTRSTVSAVGRGRRGIAITGGARSARMGCGVVRVGGSTGGEVGVGGQDWRLMW